MPTPLRLGEDTCNIPRKRGLTPEYFYQGELVSVNNPSDTSRKSAGVVLRLTGELSDLRNGVMTIETGNGILVHIPYSDVSHRVSKLIGSYVMADTLSTNPETDDMELIARGRSRRPQLQEQIPEENDSLSTIRQADPNGSQAVVDKQFVRLEFSPTEHAENESAIQSGVSRYIATMNESPAQIKNISQTTQSALAAGLTKSSPDLSALNDQLVKINARIGLIEKMITVDKNVNQMKKDEQKKLSNIRNVESKVVSFSQDQFEKDLESLSQNESFNVTKDLLKLLQEMKRHRKMESTIFEKTTAWMLTDNQPSTGNAEQCKSCTANVWLDISDTIAVRSDEEMDKFLHLQTIDWSESNLRNLSKLFLKVCLGEVNEKHVDELFASKPQLTTPHDVAQLVSWFAGWLEKVLSCQSSEQSTSDSQNPQQPDSNPADSNATTQQKKNDFFSMVLDEMVSARKREEEKQNAYQKNAAQVAMISEPFTIWHAVGSFGFSESEGMTCWHVVRMVLRFLVEHELECPWMNGTKCGVFGETPLHIALLFNNAVKNERDWRFHEMFSDLWQMCPRLHDKQYTDKLYKGENILHLAIIRNFGMNIICKILSSEKIEILLKQQAVGSFFDEPSLSYGSCNLLGEYPLFFAAGSHQIEIFELLVDHGANVDCTATPKEHNLLHLMILNDSSMTKRKQKHQQKRALLDQYMKLVQCLSNKGKLERLEKQVNKDGYSPLMLAAAEGSVEMFLHLFDERKINLAWTYGGITCKKLYLDGVDVPLNYVYDKKSMSILEILVRKKRKDILSASQIDKLVEMKWERYGCYIFYRKLGVTLFVTVAIFLLPMTKIDTSLQWRIMHTFSHAVTAFVAEYLCKCEARNSDSLIHRFIFRTWDKDMTATILRNQFLRDVKGWFIRPFEMLYQLPTTTIAWTTQAVSLLRRLVLPEKGFHSCSTLFEACSHALHVSELSLALCRHWLNPLLNWNAEVRAAAIVPFVSRVFLTMFVLRVCLQPSSATCTVEKTDRSSASLSLIDDVLSSVLRFLASIEALLYSAIGLASFASVASLFMVFEGCGSFVFMVFRVISRDLPIFVTIYSVVLLVFAHCHFLASNHLHAGVEEGMDSMWRIFSAMLGEFHEEKTLTLPLNRILVTSITVTNYFLVAVVLLNLLIAMLSSTFDEHYEDARNGWKLHRARVLVRIDRSMTMEQRRSPDKIFWQKSPTRSTVDSEERFITFIVESESESESAQ